MTHTDHVRLIQKGIIPGEYTWADMGSGEGAFTLALRDVLGPKGMIYSIDRDQRKLTAQKQQFQAQFPQTHIQYLNADFTQPITMPALDGIIAANSIHFVPDTLSILKLFGTYLKSSGRLVIVEYNTDSGNYWVPYPVSFATLSSLAAKAAYVQPVLLETEPSAFLEEIYATLLYKAI